MRDLDIDIIPLTGGLTANPREALAPVRAPDVTSPDRTSLGYRRCHYIQEGAGQEDPRCRERVVSPGDFCIHHGGFASRARALAGTRDYAKMAKGDESFRKCFEAFYADPDIASIHSELALQRTMLAGFLNRIGGGKDGSGELDLNMLSTDVIAGITSLNAQVAKLAAQVADAETKLPISISMAQIGAVIEQLVDAVSSALARELTGPVCISDASKEFDPDGVVDGKRDGDLVRRRVLARVSDSLEALIVPGHKQ